MPAELVHLKPLLFHPISPVSQMSTTIYLCVVTVFPYVSSSKLFGASCTRKGRIPIDLCTGWPAPPIFFNIQHLSENTDLPSNGYTCTYTLHVAHRYTHLGIYIASQ